MEAQEQVPHDTPTGSAEFMERDEADHAVQEQVLLPKNSASGSSYAGFTERDEVDQAGKRRRLGEDEWTQIREPQLQTDDGIPDMDKFEGLMALRESSSLENIISALKQNTDEWDDEYVIAAATSISKRIADDGHWVAELVAVMGASDALCAALTKATREHASCNTETVQAILHAIKHLAMWSDAVRDLIAEADGCNLVVQATSANLGVAGVVEAGCGAIARLSLHSDSRKGSIANRSHNGETRRAALADAGACSMLVQALNTYADNPRVVEEVLIAIGALSINCDARTISIAEAGGCVAVVQALNLHMDDTAVTRAGCTAICNLSYREASSASFVQAGAYLSIVRALTFHVNDSEVAKHGCQALANLSSFSQSRISSLAEADACLEAVRELTAHMDGVSISTGGEVSSVTADIGALAAHMDCLAITANAAEASADEQTATLSGKLTVAGAVLAVVLATIIHIENVGVAEQGCRTIAKLTTDGDDAMLTSLRQAGAPACVTRALRTHLQNGEFGLRGVVQGCRALHELSKKSDNSMKVSLGQAGAPECLALALRAHIRRSEIVQMTCSAMYYMCEGDEPAAVANKADLLDMTLPSITETLLEAKRIHPSQTEHRQIDRLASELGL